MQKVEMTPLFVSVAGGVGERYMCFIDFWHLLFRFYEEKMVA